MTHTLHRRGSKSDLAHDLWFSQWQPGVSTVTEPHRNSPGHLKFSPLIIR